MSTSNRAVIEAWFERVWTAGDVSAIDELMAPSAIFHGLPPVPEGSPTTGPDSFKPFFARFRESFPDIKIVPMRTVCEGDLVACHCKVTGTHLGEGLGVKATDAPVDFEGMTFAVIRDGQIQEGWNCYDFQELHRQVGIA